MDANTFEFCPQTVKCGYNPSIEGLKTHDFLMCALQALLTDLGCSNSTLVRQHSQFCPTLRCGFLSLKRKKPFTSVHFIELIH